MYGRSRGAFQSCFQSRKLMRCSGSQKQSLAQSRSCAVLKLITPHAARQLIRDTPVTRHPRPSKQTSWLSSFSHLASGRNVVTGWKFTSFFATKLTLIPRTESNFVIIHYVYPILERETSTRYFH